MTKRGLNVRGPLATPWDTMSLIPIMMKMMKMMMTKHCTFLIVYWHYWFTWLALHWLVSLRHSHLVSGRELTQNDIIWSSQEWEQQQQQHCSGLCSTAVEYNNNNSSSSRTGGIHADESHIRNKGYRLQDSWEWDTRDFQALHLILSKLFNNAALISPPDNIMISA